MPKGRARRRVTKLKDTAASCRQTQGVSCRQTGRVMPTDGGVPSRSSRSRRRRGAAGGPRARTGSCASPAARHSSVPRVLRGTLGVLKGCSWGTQGYSGYLRGVSRGYPGVFRGIQGTERHANDSCTAVAGHVGTRARVASARVRDQNAELLDGRVGGVEHLKARPEALMRVEPRPARACRIARSWAGVAVACVLVCLLAWQCAPNRADGTGAPRFSQLARR